MSTAKYTPGPWRVEHDYKPYIIHGNGADQIVCSIVGLAAGSKHADANARLVSAAPQLLEALTELILIDDDYEIGDLCGVVRMSSPRLTKAIAAARAAIAKATGAP